MVYVNGQLDKQNKTCDEVTMLSKSVWDQNKGRVWRYSDHLLDILHTHITVRVNVFDI